MRLVILETPYSGSVKINEYYALACLKDCLFRGEAPLASHLLYTQPGVLDDNVPDERQTGIDAGHAWIAKADAVVVYHDRGISDGMGQGIRVGIRCGKVIEYRTLSDWGRVV